MFSFILLTRSVNSMKSDLENCVAHAWTGINATVCFCAYSIPHLHLLEFLLYLHHVTVFSNLHVEGSGLIDDAMYMWVMYFNLGILRFALYECTMCCFRKIPRPCKHSDI